MSRVTEGSVRQRVGFENDTRSSLRRKIENTKEAITSVVQEVRIFRRQLKPAPAHPEDTIIFRGAQAIEHRNRAASRLWPNIERKLRLVRDKDPAHQNIKTALLLDGGGATAVANAKMLEVMQRYDLLDAFDLIVGASAGACNAAVILSNPKGDYGNPYQDIFASPKFFRSNILPEKMQLGLLEEYLWDTVDFDELRRTRPNLKVQVTDRYGKPRLLDLKRLSNRATIAAILASAAPPFYWNGGIDVDGTTYADGNIHGLPIEKLISEGYTNFVILSNDLFEEVDTLTASPLKENIALRLAMTKSKYPRAVRDATIDRRKSRKAAYQNLIRPDINFTIISPDIAVAMQSTNKNDVQKVAEAGERAMVEELTRYDVALAR